MGISRQCPTSRRASGTSLIFPGTTEKKLSNNVQPEPIATEADENVIEVRTSSNFRDHSIFSESQEPDTAEISTRIDCERNYYKVKWFKYLLFFIFAQSLAFGIYICVRIAYDDYHVNRVFLKFCP